MPSTIDNWRRVRANLQSRRHEGGATTSKAPNPVNISAIIPQQTLAYLSLTKKVRQEFLDLGMTLAQAYENLTYK